MTRETLKYDSRDRKFSRRVGLSLYPLRTRWTRLEVFTNTFVNAKPEVVKNRAAESSPATEV